MDRLNPTPKLELRISKKKLASLNVVKERARVRTNRRIQMELEERQLRELEAKSVLNEPDDMITVSDPIDESEPVKKGK